MRARGNGWRGYDHDGFPQQAGAARKPRTAPEVGSKKRRDRVVEDAGDADNLTQRLAVAPIRLPVCPHKPRALANACGRFEERNVAAQNFLHEGGHLGLEEQGGGRDV